MSRIPQTGRIHVPTQNLVFPSEDFSASAWQLQPGYTAVANAPDVTDPFGGQAATKVSYDGTHGFGTFFNLGYGSGDPPVGTLLEGCSYTMSCWLRTLTGSKSLKLTTNSALNSTAITVTSQWQRFSSGGAARSLYYNSIFGIADDPANSAAFTVYIFGMQLVRATWSGAYARSTVARIDSPASLGLRSPMSGRAAVPRSQNLFTYSEDFSNAAWVKNTGVSATAATTDVADPTGGATASKVSYDATGIAGDYRIYQIGPMSNVGSPETISVFLRVLSGSKVVRMGDNASLGALSTFTVTTAWQRFIYSGTSQGPFNVDLILYDQAAGNSPFTIYLWGAQVVFANWAGPYVATTSAVVSPNAALRNLP